MLHKLNFNDVRIDIDVTRYQLDTAIKGWLSTLSNYDIALFYFSGHGSEIERTNYIYPIDGDADSKSLILRTAWSVNDLVDSMQARNTNVNIVLLDACRDNPLSRGPAKRLLKTGFSNVSIFHNPGVLIGFSTCPGKRTSDGNARNGYYTSALLENLDLPNVKLTDLFAKVNDATQILSANSQLPYVTSSLGDHNNYCLLFDNSTFSPQRRLSDTFYREQLDEFNKKPAPVGIELKRMRANALATALSTFNGEVEKFAGSIKNDFQHNIRNVLEPGTVGDTTTWRIVAGVKSAFSPDQYLMLLFTTRVYGDQFSLTISSEPPSESAADTEHSRRLLQFETDHLLAHSGVYIQSLSNIEWGQVTTMVKNYFFDRLRFLNK